MKIDKRVTGLAMICFIVSALIVFSFAKEASDQPIEVIRNEFPSPGQTIFTFSLVANEDIEYLELRFSVMYPKILRSEEMVDPEMFASVHEAIGGYQVRAGNAPQDVLGNIRRLLWFGERMGDLGIFPDSRSRKVTIAGSEYDLLYHDYGPIMDHILGSNDTASMQLVHGSHQLHWTRLLHGGATIILPRYGQAPVDLSQ